ncbi:MAG: WG repeat-containing protein [Prolixibacteraceae bacterium]|jgi:hypothetical protein|nr:WG repeat-containing protein [Prolixibacteraceae bacterium]
MKNILYLCLSCLLSITIAKAQNDVLTRVSTSIEMEPYTTGYINSAGDTIIPIGKYSHCFTKEFDKIAIVSIKDQPGFYAIDRNEKLLFRVHRYDNGPDYVKDGLFRIIKNNKTGYANMNGEIVIQPKFDEALPFKNGYAVICKGGKKQKKGEYITRDGGKWGYINTSEKYVVQPIYESARSVKENGEAKVMKNGEWITIQVKK